jgi:hypothetical protein
VKLLNSWALFLVEKAALESQLVLLKAAMTSFKSCWQMLLTNTYEPT